MVCREKERFEDKRKWGRMVCLLYVTWLIFSPQIRPPKRFLSPTLARTQKFRGAICLRYCFTLVALSSPEAGVLPLANDPPSDKESGE